MVGTGLRLLGFGLLLPFVVFPGINLLALPLALWCLISAARRIWRRPAAGTASADHA